MSPLDSEAKERLEINRGLFYVAPEKFSRFAAENSYSSEVSERQAVLGLTSHKANHP
jgi:hypothetical protein